MAPTTEVIYLKVDVPANLSDPSTKEGRLFKDFVEATKKVSGVNHFFWGVAEEKDDNYNTVCVIGKSSRALKGFLIICLLWEYVYAAANTLR